jgi:hypothetical protein
MTDQTQDSAITQTVALLEHYGFELKGRTAAELITQWLEQYQAVWVRLAVVEALYLGRYKAVSVAQILKCWDRRGNPHFHFNHDFERLICRKLPRFLGNLAEASPVMEEDYRLFSSNPKFSEVKPQPKQFYDSTDFSCVQNDNSTPSIDKSPVFAGETSEDSIASAKEKSDKVERIPLQVEESRSEIVSAAPTKEIELEKTQSKISTVETGSTESSKDLGKYNSEAIETENCSESRDSTSPIHQFTPSPDLSQSFSKLKAVAEKVKSKK